MLENFDIFYFDCKQIYLDISNNYCFNEFPYFRSEMFFYLNPKHNIYRVNKKLMLHLMVNVIRLCQWTFYLKLEFYLFIILNFWIKYILHFLLNSLNCSFHSIVDSVKIEHIHLKPYGNSS